MTERKVEKVTDLELETEGGTVVIREFGLDGDDTRVIHGRYKDAAASDPDIRWDLGGGARAEPHKWDLNRQDEATERFLHHVERRRREFMLGLKRR